MTKTKTITKFEENIMELLRKKNGLDVRDTSKDREINKYSVNGAYKALLVFGHYYEFDIQVRKEYIEAINDGTYKLW